MPKSFAVIYFDRSLVRGQRGMEVVVYFEGDRRMVDRCLRTRRCLQILHNDRFAPFWMELVGAIQKKKPTFAVKDSWNHEMDDWVGYTDEDFDKIFKALEKYQIACSSFLDQYTDKMVCSYALVRTDNVLFSVLAECRFFNEAKNVRTFRLGSPKGYRSFKRGKRTED